jgi:alginate O-acetyltransferase complex protein AlgI
LVITPAPIADVVVARGEFRFYGSWNPWLLFVVVFSAGFDFLIAQRIEASPSPKQRRFLLIISVGVSLSILAFFKYTNFLLDSAVSTFNFFGFDYRHPAFAIVLPLGISFYTFETISYVIDVYRGRLHAERNFLDYALFIMFFPHLIAGPSSGRDIFFARFRDPNDSTGIDSSSAPGCFFWA